MLGSQRFAALRILGFLLLPALAAGCGGKAPPPPSATGPATALPAGPVAVDGTYQGTKVLVRGDGGPGLLCGSLDPFSVTVAGRAFHYVLHQPEIPYQATRVFAVTIDTDGAFKATDGPTYIAGNAGGGTMQGEVSGDVCGYTFEADRLGQ
jgi:hypothetical protein